MSHYKPYPAYRDSGVEWIGDVPSDWQTERIKHTSSLRTDRRTDAPDGSQYIGLEDVESGTGQYRPTAGSARQNEDSTVGVFKSGDVLYGKLRPYLKKAIVSDSDGVCSTEFLVLQPKTVLAPWLHQWLLTAGVTQQIEAGCEGTKMPRADWEHVGSIHVPSPDASEQAEIIAVLDRETKRIDSLIAKKTRFIELLKEKRQALITHAVTKGLDPNVKMRNSGVEWIEEVPEHWSVLKGSWIGTLFGSEQVPEESVVSEGDLPFLKVGSMSLNSFDIESWDWYVSRDISKRCRTRSDFILFPKRGAAIFTNKVNIVDRPSVIDPNLMGWKIGSKAVTKFIAYALKSRRLDDLADVSTVPQINNKHIEPEKFPVPPLDEQREIVKYIDQQSSKIDLISHKTQRSIDLLKERRSAFITAAVTGQIDLREPA